MFRLFKATVSLAWTNLWHTAKVIPVVFSLVGLTSLNANAIGVVDQSNVVPPSGNFSAVFGDLGGQQVGQTFTVGLDGILSEVSMYIEKRGTTIASLVAEIQGVSGGLPDGSVFATASLSAGSVIDGLNSFDVSSANLSVNVNDVYAIVLKSTAALGDDYLADTVPGDLYTAGKAVTNNSGGGWTDDGINEDAIFQTKVTPVPEAETYTMILVGLGLVGWATQRRRQIY